MAHAENIPDRDDELDEDLEDALDLDDDVVGRAPQPGNTPSSEDAPYDEGAITSYPDDLEAD